MIEFESVEIQCTLHRERESGGKESERSKKGSPASDRPHGVVCEKSPVSRLKASNECEVKARQRARGRKERRKSKSDGKGDELKKGATIQRRETRQMKTYGDEANDPINDYMSEELAGGFDWQGVERDVHGMT